MTNQNLKFPYKIQIINQKLAKQIKSKYGQVAFDHLVFENGISFAILDKEKIIGFISIHWQKTEEDNNKIEGYIDIIEVHPSYRRQGIGRKLVDLVYNFAKKERCYQIRVWSSLDKHEAIKMWKKLEFEMEKKTIISERTGESVSGYFVKKKIT